MAAKKGLTEAQRKAIIQTFLTSRGVKTLADIGREYGVTAQNISRIVNKFLKDTKDGAA